MACSEAYMKQLEACYADVTAMIAEPWIASDDGFVYAGTIVGGLIGSSA